MKTDGYHVYRVDFMYKNKTYFCEFLSTAKITPQTDKLVAWGIADDAIISVLKQIPNRVKGVYPYSIVISGEFGCIKVKD